MKNKILFFIALSLLLSTGNADNPEWKWLFNCGYGWGGDTLEEIRVYRYYEDDYDYYWRDSHYEGRSTADIRAGTGVLLSAGGILAFDKVPVEAMFTIGWYYDSETGEDFDMYFTRMPVDLAAYYVLGNSRFGAGITIHTGPELDVDLDYDSSYSVDFDDATGSLIEYAYQLEWMRFFARYTFIDYKVNSYTVNGDHFLTGIGLSW